MNKQELFGKCIFCGKRISKAKIRKHLETCKQRKIYLMKLIEDTLEIGKKRIFHLLITTPHRVEYWMHVELPEDKTLKDLDDFIRDIWVECCGHLSAFTIENTRYYSHYEDLDRFNLHKIKEENMDIPAGNVLHVGLKFNYEYDFGSPTRLTLKVLSEREGSIKEKSIQLLARNESPKRVCVVCGKPAKWICTQCIAIEKEFLCEECAKEHECGEDMLLPLVNSPRAGVCGYLG